MKLINRAQPLANDFALAKGVTLRGRLGGHERWPELVPYGNGITVGMIELKDSRTSIANGMRQNLSNRLSEFNTCDPAPDNPPSNPDRRATAAPNPPRATHGLALGSRKLSC